MKIKLTRSRWPWGRPKIVVDFEKHPGFVFIQGASEKRIRFKHEKGKPALRKFVMKGIKNK